MCWTDGYDEVRGVTAMTSSIGQQRAPQLPGVVVTSSGGQTKLPDASATDFVPGELNVLDRADATYPTLSTAHVATFRAIGTPEELIARIAEQSPASAELDAYIQDEIMRNPEGWDSRTGQQPGTARAGLMRLIPGVQLGGVAPTTYGLPAVEPQAMFTPLEPGIGSGTKLALGGGGIAIVGGGGYVLHKRALARAIAEHTPSTAAIAALPDASDVARSVVSGGGGVASVADDVGAAGSRSVGTSVSRLEQLLHAGAANGTAGADVLRWDTQRRLIQRLDGEQLARVFGTGSSDVARGVTSLAPALDDALRQLSALRRLL